MKNYFVKTPWWLRKLYPSYLWKVDTEEKILYLTFDDGPHPEATPFVLDVLKEYQAKATFFCIGKNVAAWPDIYKRVLDEGHSAGNHTQNHLNGWKTADDVYMKDIAVAAKFIDSGLFRPPYGKITSFQAKNLRAAIGGRTSKVVMWDVLSGDFDISLSGEDCLKNTALRSEPGSIVIFHDSEKAFPRLRFCLPKALQFFSEKGFRFERIDEKLLMQTAYK